MNGTLKEVRVDAIQPNPRQPRKYFAEQDIKELADSLQDEGMLQLIKLEQVDEVTFYIRDGERRWRAAQMLGWETVQAIVYTSEEDAEQRRLFQALAANIHREGLNPIERAMAYQHLMDDGVSKLEIARRLRTSITTVSHMIDLLNLEPELQDMLAVGKLPSDHRCYKALVTIPAGEIRVKLAKRVAREGVSIRTVERACEELRNRLAEAKRVAQTQKILGDSPKPETKPRPTKHSRTNRAPSTILALGDTVEMDVTKKTWSAVQAAAAGACTVCDVNPRLAQVPSPSWELFLLSAEETCDSCQLRPKDRNFLQSVCGVCPAVVILSKLAKHD